MSVNNLLFNICCLNVEVTDFPGKTNLWNIGKDITTSLGPQSFLRRFVLKAGPVISVCSWWEGESGIILCDRAFCYWGGGVVFLIGITDGIIIQESKSG